MDLPDRPHRAPEATQSARLSGTITNKGQVVRIDIGFLRSGAVSGSVSGPVSWAPGVSVHLIVTGGAAYILVDKQFFHRVLQRNGLRARACAVFCGKCIKVPAGQFGNFNLKALIHEALGSVVKISPAVTSATVNDQQAYRLADTLKGQIVSLPTGTG